MTDSNPTSGGIDMAWTKKADDDRKTGNQLIRDADELLYLTKDMVKLAEYVNDSTDVIANVDLDMEEGPGTPDLIKERKEEVSEALENLQFLRGKFRDADRYVNKLVSALETQ